MRWIKYLIASSILLLCCNKKVTYTLYEGDPLEETQKSSRSNKCCRDRVHYVPDALQEVKTLRVCFHYMYDSAGRHNLDKDKAKKFAKELIQSCNKVLQAAIQPNLGGDTLDALPKGYQLKIFPATDLPEDDGFYFHKDDDLYYFIAYGKNKNNYDTKVIRKYALKKDSFINIFMMPHHPDSVKSESYRVRRNGIALGTGLKVAGYYSRNLWPGEFAGLTNHEIGHTLGLSHSWNSSDGCDDTPRHNNCWNFEKEPPCDKEVSNNMMDYNVFQNALTPCQLSWIHRNLTRWSSKTRKLVVPTWCEKKDTVWIKEPTIWESEKDLPSDIIIMEGGHLTVKCRLSLPENGFIRVDPGAQLTLDNAWLHNSCNKPWQGIKVGKKGNREGSVETKGTVRIDLYPLTREKT